MVTIHIEAPTLLDRVVGAAGVLALASTAFGLWRAWRARRWPVAPGEVLEVRTARRRGGMTSGYVPEVRYRYVVGHETLTGTRLQFGWQTAHGSERAALEAVGELRPGAPLPVAYNPRRPTDAVVWHGPTVADLMGVVIGAVLAFYGLRS